MHILTFDIEEWFHILDNPGTAVEHQWDSYEYRLEKNCETIISLLDKHGLKATFFVLGWVARKFPGIVSRICDLGHEIGTHSDLHQLVYNQSWGEFAADLEASVRSIEDVTGTKVRSYRAPGFSVKGDLVAFHDALTNCGIDTDCSIFPSRRAHGGLPGFPSTHPCLLRRAGCDIREFPVSSASVFGKRMIYSGGGYFRLAPYWVIRRLSSSSDYVMTYFHPRDFDAGQPVLPGLSPLRRFKSYYGLRQSRQKLDRWLSDTRMTSLADAVAEIDWKNAPVIALDDPLAKSRFTPATTNRR